MTGIQTKEYAFIGGRRHEVIVAPPWVIAVVQEYTRNFFLLIEQEIDPDTTSSEENTDPDKKLKSS